jgi:hypothetical protein
MTENAGQVPFRQAAWDERLREGTASRKSWLLLVSRANEEKP